MHMATGLRLTAWVGLLALGSWAFLGCQEDFIVTLDGDLVPIDAVTVEVGIPFHEFAGDLEGWGGYGRPYELARPILARQFEGNLDSRLLNSWFPYPVSALVRDSAGAFVTDSTLTFVKGRIVARFDTLTSIMGDSVTLAVSVLPRDWDFGTATWDVAVDSVGDRQEWAEPGGGPGTPVATAVWDPSVSDSVVFEIDSASLGFWADSAQAKKGVRVDVVTEGTRLDMVNLVYLLSTRPSSHPDTIVELGVGSETRTFIYRPAVEAPGEEIRVGGVPAWRTLFTMDLPDVLNGPAELCEQVQCPLTLTPESVVSASLVLTTRAPPPGFQPRDSLYLDVRPVLEPSRLPKSPLGSSLVGALGVVLTPADFGEEVGAEIEVPLGGYVQGLIAQKTNPELEFPHTLALLSSFEPLSLYFAAFEGPDSPMGPELRLILTFTEDVRIR